MDAARCRVLPTAHTRRAASLDTAGIERTDTSDASKYAEPDRNPQLSFMLDSRPMIGTRILHYRIFAGWIAASQFGCPVSGPIGLRRSVLKVVVASRPGVRQQTRLSCRVRTLHRTPNNVSMASSSHSNTSLMARRKI
jgi:hypothetical protein